MTFGHDTCLHIVLKLNMCCTDQLKHYSSITGVFDVLKQIQWQRWNHLAKRRMSVLPVINVLFFFGLACVSLKQLMNGVIPGSQVAFVVL